MVFRCLWTGLVIRLWVNMILSYCCRASTRLKLHSFDIHLEIEPRVGPRFAKIYIEGPNNIVLNKDITWNFVTGNIFIARMQKMPLYHYSLEFHDKIQTLFKKSSCTKAKYNSSLFVNNNFNRGGHSGKNEVILCISY